MEHYKRFKKWAEQEKVQRILNILILGTVLFIVGTLLLFYKNDTAFSRFSRVLDVFKEAKPIIISPTVAPIITNTSLPSPMPTDKPTPTAKEYHPQFVQQNASNISCTGPDGKVFQTTQQECDSFNTAWKKPQQNNAAPQMPQGTTQTTSSSQPKITCVLSFGTYQLTQSDCDSFKKPVDTSNPPPGYINCELPTGISLLTVGACEYFKKGYQQLNEKYNPAPTPDNSYNQQQNSQCKMYANQWYTNQGTQCSGSCAEAAKQIAYPQYQQKLKDCDSQYPI